jgi:outer membrane cobalamin receptor
MIQTLNSRTMTPFITKPTILFTLLHRSAWAILCILFFTFSASAQDLDKIDIKDLDKFSFDALLDIDLLQVASKKPLSKKDVPGVVTLVKRDEIQSSGARDLIDVLRLVPGFEFAGDVQGVVGIGTRGNWGHEGKVLMMIDGMPLNELLFATVAYGNRFAIDQIERIEIIRGPGSSFYGGFAELAVINIITRAAQDIDGVAISGNFGQMQNALGRINGNLSFGKKFGDVAIGISAFLGQANRSDQQYTGLDSVSFPMQGNHTMQPLNLSLNVKTGDFQARLMYDRYNTTQRNGAGQTLPQAFSTNFTSLLADVRYDWKLSEQFTLSPRLSYTRQQPWNLTDEAATSPTSLYNYLVINKTVERALGSLALSADISQNLYMTLGAEYYLDNASASSIDPPFALYNDSRSVQYSNIGVFLQALLTTDIVNVNAGLRFDKYSVVPAALVPWLGLTKTFDKLNVKLLFGQNFRAPSIENIRLNPNIRPERTTAIELELGYQLQYNMFLSLNAFDLSISDVIVFGNVNGINSYNNYERTGTRGVELEYFFKDSWGFVNFNYSFYVAQDNRVEQYRVWSYRPRIGGGTGGNARETTFSNDAALLGFAPHKITLNSSFNLSMITEGLSINPSLIFLSSRFAITNLRPFENIQTVQELGSTTLINVFINYKNAFTIQGLDLGAGVYDVLGTNFGFIQPYNSGGGILPGPSREFLLKASYRLRFQ